MAQVELGHCAALSEHLLVVELLSARGALLCSYCEATLEAVHAAMPSAPRPLRQLAVALAGNADDETEPGVSNAPLPRPSGGPSSAALGHEHSGGPGARLVVELLFSQYLLPALRCPEEYRLPVDRPLRARARRNLSALALGIEQLISSEDGMEAATADAPANGAAADATDAHTGAANLTSDQSGAGADADVAAAGGARQVGRGGGLGGGFTRYFTPQLLVTGPATIASCAQLLGRSVAPPALPPAASLAEVVVLEDGCLRSLLRVLHAHLRTELPLPPALAELAAQAADVEPAAHSVSVSAGFGARGPVRACFERSGGPARLWAFVLPSAAGEDDGVRDGGAGEPTLSNTRGSAALCEFISSRAPSGWPQLAAALPASAATHTSAAIVSQQWQRAATAESLRLAALADVRSVSKRAENGVAVDAMSLWLLEFASYLESRQRGLEVPLQPARTLQQCSHVHHVSRVRECPARPNCPMPHEIMLWLHLCLQLERSRLLLSLGDVERASQGVSALLKPALKRVISLVAENLVASQPPTVIQLPAGVSPTGGRVPCFCHPPAMYVCRYCSGRKAELEDVVGRLIASLDSSSLVAEPLLALRRQGSFASAQQTAHVAVAAFCAVEGADPRALHEQLLRVAVHTCALEASPGFPQAECVGGQDTMMLEHCHRLRTMSQAEVGVPADICQVRELEACFRRPRGRAIRAGPMLRRELGRRACSALVARRTDPMRARLAAPFKRVVQPRRGDPRHAVPPEFAAAHTALRPASVGRCARRHRPVHRVCFRGRLPTCDGLRHRPCSASRSRERALLRGQLLGPRGLRGHVALPLCRRRRSRCSPLPRRTGRRRSRRGGASPRRRFHRLD